MAVTKLAALIGVAVLVYSMVVYPTQLAEATRAASAGPPAPSTPVVEFMRGTVAQLNRLSTSSLR